MLGVIASKLSNEGNALLAAMAKYGTALRINPDDVYHSYVRGALRPRIMLARPDGDVDLSALQWAIVRGTTDHEAAVALLVYGLQALEVPISDPWSRFVQLGKASKLLSTATRWHRRIGTTSHIAFSLKGLERIIGDATNFPLVVKPPSGRHGAGVKLLETPQAARYLLNQYLADGLLLQQYIDFQREFRILIHDGTIIGAAEKLRKGQRFDADGVKGARFEKCDVPDDIAAMLPQAVSMGIVGVDVGIAPDGSLHVIEENYAPEFERLAKAHDVDLAIIADAIVAFGPLRKD